MDMDFIGQNCPYIILSSSCKVLELSEQLLLCRGHQIDRDTVLRFFSSTDVERLKTFCREDYVPPEDPLSNIKNSIVLPLRHLGYRYAVAIKLPYLCEPFTALYLTEHSMSGCSAKDLLLMRVPQSVETIINGMCDSTDVHNSSQKLLSSGEMIRIFDTEKLIESMISKLTQRGKRINSELVFDCFNDAGQTDSGSQCGRVKLGAFVLTFVSLVSVLDMAVSKPHITVRLNKYSESAEIVMSGETDIDFPFAGTTSDILSLASYIQGSCSLLAFASYTVAENDMYIGFQTNATGHILKLYFGYIPDQPSELDFKYRDPEPEIDDMMELALLISESPEVTEI